LATIGREEVVWIFHRINPDFEIFTANALAEIERIQNYNRFFYLNIFG
jgi:hypothetical protein